VDAACSGGYEAIGWVEKRSDQQPEVDLVINGVLKQSFHADVERQDLVDAGLSHARGFQISLRPYLKPGSNKIELRFAGTRQTINGGRSRVTVKNPSDKKMRADTYETLYETNAQQEFDGSVGGGDYHEVGLTEMELLRMEGLKPADTMIDLGCGNGRLAVHAVSFLKEGGTYIGIDIAKTYLQKAADRIARVVPGRTCAVEWVHQTTPSFVMADQSVDMICAFSVFTHMEHEDAYNYLKSALRIVRPGGKFIFSCLPLHTASGQHVFHEEAKLSLDARWDKVRNVTTTMDLMTVLSEMAGWKVERWYEGEENNIGLPNGVMRRLGQSSCVLKAPK
jgi:ubiquinone/menaquinone biosynthesis C-methylase UbiE